MIIIEMLNGSMQSKTIQCKKHVCKCACDSCVCVVESERERYQCHSCVIVLQLITLPFIYSALITFLSQRALQAKIP